MLFRDGKQIDKVQGANLPQLEAMVKKLKAGVSGAGSEGSSSSSSSEWKGAEFPRGYTDINDQIETKRCELLNVDSDFGGVRVLFDSSKPSALAGGKGDAKDWVESDTDEQLMLFIPFQSMVKLHTLQVSNGRERRNYAAVYLKSPANNKICRLPPSPQPMATTTRHQCGRRRSSSSATSRTI